MQRLLRFWSDYVRRYRGWFLLGVLCLVATNALTVAIPGFVEMAIDALGTGQGAAGAMPWVWAIFAAGIGIMVVRTLSRTLFFNPGRSIEFRVKSAMFGHLLVQPQAYFDQMRTGDLISRGTNDTNGMRALVGFGSLQLFNVIFILLLTIGRMVQMDAWLTLWCVLPLVGAAIFLRYAVVAMFRLFGQMQAQVATLSERILEGYTGVGVLQAYDALPGAFDRFDVDNDRLLDLGTRLLMIRSWMLPVVAVIGNLCVVIVLYLGGRRVIGIEGAPSMTVGQLAGFVVYVNILVAGVTSLGWLIGSVQRGYISLGRVYEVLDAHNVRPTPSADMPSVPGGHRFEVKDLTFTHPGAKEPSLVDVSFTVEPGEVLGIFGLTGSGKSTLLDVLARVYDPPEGTVMIDDVDVRAIPVKTYWDSVAYVGQEAYLFSRTVRENIALGHHTDDIDDDRLQQAVDAAALTPDIGSLAEGLNTVVGERGVTLSGGQRQRTALARVFYRDFDVLLLDDVMSAVDHATEKALIDAIYRRTKGRTTLIVSHRISVLSHADRVIVLDEGRLVEEGVHQALASGDGPYSRAWALQRAAEALKADDV